MLYWRNGEEDCLCWLLANISNAFLNVAEGVTAPIYMNGVGAFAKTVVPAVGLLTRLRVRWV